MGAASVNLSLTCASSFASPKKDKYGNFQIKKEKVEVILCENALVIISSGPVFSYLVICLSDFSLFDQMQIKYLKTISKRARN